MKIMTKNSMVRPCSCLGLMGTLVPGNFFLIPNFVLKKLEVGEKNE